MATTAVQLSAVAPILLPPTIADPIFTKAKETSAVMALARKVPLAVNAQTAIPVPMDVPTAGFVAEGAAKPVATAGMGVKIMTGKKLALLLPVSQEIAMTNPAGLYDQLQQDLPTAMSRSFDYAAIHGLDLRTGAAGPFGTSNALVSTPNTQVIGASAASAGGVYADLVLGMRSVVNGPVPYEFGGFAADPRLVPELMLSTDTQGRPLMVDAYPNANDGGPHNLKNSLIGFPAYYNAGVSGKYYRSENSVQIFTLVGTPTGGTYTITYGGQSTAPIAYNAASTTIATAINAISVPAAFGYGGAGGASVATVTGSAPGPFTVTFPIGQGAPIQVNQTALTGGTAAASVATVTQSPVADLGTRAIGGDWSQCAYGIGMDISIKVSTQASYVDGAGTTHSAFQENLVLLLVETYVGFVVNDVNAFVSYTHAAGS